MTSDDLLDTEITPAHQQLAARLALACADLDADQLGAGLAEVAAGGCALPVVALMARNQAATMVEAHGLDLARAILQKTITDADAAGDEA